MQHIPYACLSVTIETDDQAYLKRLKGGPLLEKRWELVREAHSYGVHTQITVSPCLPYTSVEQFGERLLQSGAHRLVIDTFVDGDGSDGERTARSPFAMLSSTWETTDHAHQLYRYLCEKAVGTELSIGWSSAGFCGITPRHS
jgi:DNA repair photolyase